MAAVNVRTTQILLNNNIPNPILHPVASFTFLFTPILGFLQLKYQQKQQSPFDTHPSVTYVGIVCLLLCYLGYNVELRLSSNLRLRKYVWWIMVFSGSVCLASTVSILFPDWIRPILFLIFLVIAAAELLHSLSSRIVYKITEFYHRRRRSTVRGPILPQ